MPTATKLNKVDSPEHGPRPRGKVTELTLHQFIRSLLEHNELVKDGKHLTDAEIRQQVMDEFADFPATVEAIRQKPRNIVAIWRSAFHKGRFNYKGKTPIKPTTVSFRYNTRGEPVNPRTMRPLTRQEQKDLCTKLGIRDRRFVR